MQNSILYKIIYIARIGATALLPADWTLSQQVRDPVLHCWAKAGVATARMEATTVRAILVMLRYSACSTRGEPGGIDVFGQGVLY